MATAGEVVIDIAFRGTKAEATLKKITANAKTAEQSVKSISATPPVNIKTQPAVNNLERLSQAFEKTHFALGKTVVDALKFGGIFGLLFQGTMLLRGAFSQYATAMESAAEKAGLYNKTTAETARQQALQREISAADVKAYAQSRQALDRLSLSFSLFSYRLISAAMPAVTALMNGLNSVAKWLSDNGAALTRFFTVFSALLALTFLPRFLATVAAVTKGLTTMSLAMLKSPVTWLVAALAGLALVLEDLYVYIKGGNSALGGLWSKLIDVDNGTVTLTKAGQVLMTVISGLSSLFAFSFIGRLGGVVKALSSARGAIRLLASGLTLLSSAGTLAIGAVIKALAALKVALFSNPITAVLTLLAMAATYVIMNWDTVKAAVLSAWSYIQERLGAGAQWVTDKWNGFKDSVAALWDSIKALWEQGCNYIGDVFANFILAPIEYVKGVFNSFINYITSAVSGVWDKFKGMLPSWLGGTDETEQKAASFKQALPQSLPPTAASAVNNRTTTLTDNRTITMNINGAQSPTATANAVHADLSADNSYLMSNSGVR